MKVKHTLEPQGPATRSYVRAITAAKKPDTRTKRIEAMLEKLRG